MTDLLTGEQFEALLEQVVDMFEGDEPYQETLGAYSAALLAVGFRDAQITNLEADYGRMDGQLRAALKQVEELETAGGRTTVALNILRDNAGTKVDYLESQIERLGEALADCQEREVWATQEAERLWGVLEGIADETCLFCLQGLGLCEDEGRSPCVVCVARTALI